MTSKTSTIIDYLTFSIPVYPGGDVLKTTWAHLLHVLPNWAQEAGAWEWTETSGRAPYDRSYSSPGFRIYAGANVEHISIQVSGLGCKMLRELDLMNYVMEHVHERLSRIDIAVDIETDLPPLDFIEPGFNAKIKTIGHVASEHGQTAYIGSQKSNRYARVYRYHGDHPRAHLLRLEYVFRKREAKKVGKDVFNKGVESVGKQAGRSFDWKHPIMQELVSDQKLTAAVEHRNEAKTLRWLQKQAAPAFQKMVAAGVIENPMEWLQIHFLQDAD